MEKEKFYFASVDDTFCQSLSYHLHDAKSEGLEKITLIEAIPNQGHTEDIWCTYNGEVVDRSDCKKSQCSYYSSKSGRGACEHRGDLYLHGEEFTFDVNSLENNPYA